MEYDPETGLLELSLMDLEHCDFSHEELQGELSILGYNVDDGDIVPDIVLINYIGGAVVTKSTEEETLKIMQEKTRKYNFVTGIVQKVLKKYPLPESEAANIQAELIEDLADLEHQQWAHWTEYMLNNLAPENIERWKQQIKTPYSALSEKEKGSDRDWANNVMMTLAAFSLTHPKKKVEKNE